mmetsp:Transcript_6560/g.20736  ORF Transcript_6560/g.20736 Transcript_6560/m.20736 type:complete len:101 (-) Transcript_6560:83-385(-)
MSRRAYYPNWGWDVDGRNYEKCCEKKSRDETTFKLDELLFEPFHLTKQDHVPKSIVEKLYLNGFMCLILEMGVLLITSSVNAMELIPRTIETMILEGGVL